MDEELRDLCIEVNKRFGWDDRDSGRRFIAREIGEDVDADLGGNTVSLFTSDYLLEKLPPKLPGRINFWLFVSRKPGDEWNAWYDGTSHITHAETPLKALLKLVLALDDAGVKL